MKSYVLPLLLSFTTFSLTGATQAQFIDVDVTHPYFHSIGDLYQANVVKGYDVEGDRFFKPRQSINRAEVLKVLMLSAGLTAEAGIESRFPDVPGQAWFADFVQTAAARGIVKGYVDGRFYPEVKVTRAEFLKMLMESFDVPLKDTDEDIWYAPYLETAQAWRLLPEEDDPDAYVNRGEVAEVIFRTKEIQDSEFSEKYTYRAEGKASYYNQGFAGKSTANGESYDPNAFTAAHRTLPFGTRLKVYNEDRKFVVVRINDRGPYHEDRVLDLSQRAFEELAPISRGVIEVSLEVLSEPDDETPAIPEQIRPSLNLESRNPEVPSTLYNRLRKPAVELDQPEERTLPTTQALFAESIQSLPVDFYEGVMLRSFIPQKLVAGQVLKISGRVTDDRRPKTATLFFKNKATDEQQTFVDEVSGQNFELAVPFYAEGIYEMGLVFDDERRSRVGEIEVVESVQNRRFPASEVRFASDLQVETVPEDSLVLLRWASEASRLSRLTFVQGNKTKRLVFERGLNAFALPYSFLDADFGPNSPLVIKLEQANSIDGTWQNQQTNWKFVTDRSFVLTAGFPDIEKKDVISLSNFSRYHRTLDPIVLRGQVLDSEVRVAEFVYITNPDGIINMVEAKFIGPRTFEFELDPAEYGRHVVEIVTDLGEILFNRAVYFNSEVVLPVLPKAYTDIKLGNKSGILHWTNTIRAENRRSVLVADSVLGAVAQRYANRMAEEGFIAHVAPDGETLSDRIEPIEGFTQFGENLAYGSTLELALNGLEDSASHYQNIKNSNWKKVGIGLANNEDGEVYVVQIFAK